MDHKNYIVVTSVIFLIIFILHGVRIFFGWDAVLGGWEVPMWLSWIAVFATGFLAYSGFSLGGFIGKK